MSDDYESARLPSSDDYENAKVDVRPHHENILQRAAKSLKDTMGFGNANKSPFEEGLSSTMGGMKSTPGLGPYMIGHDMKSAVIDNPVLDIASDPELFIGGGMAKKGVEAGADKAGKVGGSLARGMKYSSEANKSTRIQNILQKSAKIKNSNMGRKFGDTLKSFVSENPEKPVSGIAEVIQRHSNDPEVASAISKSPAVKKLMLGEQPYTDAVSGKSAVEATVKDVQNAINELEAHFPYKPFGKGSFSAQAGQSLISELKELQASAFEGMGALRKEYGEFKEGLKLVRPNISDSRVTEGLKGGLVKDSMRKEAVGNVFHKPVQGIIKDTALAEKVKDPIHKSVLRKFNPFTR